MLRPSPDQPNDIVFEAEEDLFHNSPSRELLMLKGAIKVVPLSRNRIFQSYVNEFCGMVSASCGARGGVLASNTLRFSMTSQSSTLSLVDSSLSVTGTGSTGATNRCRIDQVNPCKIVNTPCLVKVSHTQDFLNAPNNSLKPALRTIYEQGFCSDLILNYDGKRSFNVHKAILAVRSKKLSKLIATGSLPSEQRDSVPEIKLTNVSYDSLCIIYSWSHSTAHECLRSFSSGYIQANSEAPCRRR
jgi:hypothetical protein